MNRGEAAKAYAAAMVEKMFEGKPKAPSDGTAKVLVRVLAHDAFLAGCAAIVPATERPANAQISPTLEILTERAAIRFGVQHYMDTYASGRYGSELAAVAARLGDVNVSTITLEEVLEILGANGGSWVVVKCDVCERGPLHHVALLGGEQRRTAMCVECARRVASVLETLDG